MKAGNQSKLDLKSVPEYKYYINLSRDKIISDSTFLLGLSRIIKAPYLSDDFKEIARHVENTFWLKGIPQRKRRTLLGVYRGYMSSNSSEAAMQELYGGMQKTVDSVVLTWHHKKHREKVRILADLIEESAKKHLDQATTRFVYILNELQLKKRDIFKAVVLTINYEDILK